MSRLNMQRVSLKRENGPDILYQVTKQAAEVLGEEQSGG